MEENKAMLLEDCTFQNNEQRSVHVRAGAVIEYEECDNNVIFQYDGEDISLCRTEFNCLFKEV